MYFICTNHRSKRKEKNTTNISPRPENSVLESFRWHMFVCWVFFFPPKIFVDEFHVRMGGIT